MKIDRKTQAKIDELRRLAAEPYTKPPSREQLIQEECSIAFRAALPSTRHERQVRSLISTFRKAMRPPELTGLEHIDASGI